MFSVIDTNKDGKISLEEFIFWWSYGRGQNEEINIFKLKALKVAKRSEKHIVNAAEHLSKFKDD